MNLFSAKLIFISEPQVYKCDLASLVQPFLGSYDSHLNSEDSHDMDLPLTHPKAKGGTMVMWHNSLSPHLRVLKTPSPSFMPVLLLEQHFKVHLQRLLRLHQATPAPVVYLVCIAMHKYVFRYIVQLNQRAKVEN